jgi:hypothetical protein
MLKVKNLKMIEKEMMRKIKMIEKDLLQRNLKIKKVEIKKAKQVMKIKNQMMNVNLPMQRNLTRLKKILKIILILLFFMKLHSDNATI